MGKYVEDENKFAFRPFPENPEDGEEFTIMEDGKIVKAVWDASKGKWIKK